MSSTTSIQLTLGSKEDVELHCTNSTVDFPTKSGKDREPLPHKQLDVFTYTASTMTSFFSSLKEFKIEVVMFMYMFSSLMRHVSTTTLILDKVCLVHLDFSQEECKNLAFYPDKKMHVEKLANNYIVGHNMIQMIPACIIAAFIGAWSDKYGRRIPLIIALIGIILDGLSTTICAAAFISRVEYVLLSAAFTGFFGGVISAMTIIYSYASDITTSRKRTLKYAIMEVAFGLSYPLGDLAGGWLYKLSGYVPVFLASTGGHLFSLAWVILVLDETKGLDNTDAVSVKLRSLFSFTPVIEGVRATLKSRPNNGKKKLLLLVLALTISVVSYASASNINFLYVHHQYDWDNTQYSTVSSTFSIVGIFIMAAVVPALKYFNFGDPTLGIVGNASILAKNVTLGFSFHSGFYYLAQACGLLASLGPLAARSSISKVISKDDLGKVFSFITTSESLLHVIVAAVASQFFNASLGIFPGLVFLGAAVLLIIPIVVFVWLGRQPSDSYEEMGINSQNDGQELDGQIHTKQLELQEKS